MNPLDFIASLDGEAKAAALTVYNLMTPKRIEITDDSDTSSPAVWCRRHLPTGRLTTDRNGCVTVWTSKGAQMDLVNPTMGASFAEEYKFERYTGRMDRDE